MPCLFQDWPTAATAIPNTENVLNVDEDSAEKNDLVEVLEDSYRTIHKTYSFEKYSGKAITRTAEESVLEEYSNLLEVGPKEYPNLVVKIKQGETAEFTVNAPIDGLYAVQIEYYDLSDSTLPIKMGIKIDGAYPFYEMSNQKFESSWTYKEGKFPTDRYNNEIVPESKRLEKWNTKYIEDASGLTDSPFLLALSKGEHLFTFSCDQGTILIGSIALVQAPAPSYKQEGVPEGNEFTVIEAESPSVRNDATIRPAAEYNMELTPYSSKNTVLNMLSGGSFSEGGQKVTYIFEVPRTGYYYIAFRYRQSSKSNFPTFRDVAINGSIYSPSFKNVAFNYCKNFTNMTVKNPDTGERAGVYLEKGTSHSITLSVNLQNMSPFIDEINSIIRDVNNLSLKIMKITGNNTQKYRDFELDEYIPDLEKTLVSWADQLQELYDRLHEYNPKAHEIGEFSAIKVCRKQLISLSKKPNDLPKRLDELHQGQNSVGQYLANVLEALYKSPLALDKIIVYQDENCLPDSPGIIRRIWESVRRFYYSFFANAYATTAEEVDSENLQVWVSRSRLYVEIMQSMADTDFYNQYGYKADLSIMSDEDKLVLAMAAGNAPDVALSVTYTIPFELAIRGSLKNLKEYDGWERVTSRFKSGLVNTGVVDGGLYSLPETTNVYIMFYRTDILDQLGMKAPNTMQEVKQMLPGLKRYGMDFYSHVAGNSTKSLSMMVPFIYQNGGSFYGKTALDLQLDSDSTLDAITEMTQLFTMYDIPFEVSSFYQHFRSGLMPIGISDINTYIMLLNSAPEIANSWNIAPYPGVEDAEGNVQRWVGGASKSCVIFSDTDKSEESWKFLDWWTSSKTQSAFADTLQTSYGKEYIWNTANVESFANLPWNEEHKEVMLNMLDWIVEAPRV